MRVASVGASKGRRMKERQGRGREGEIEKERNEEAVPAFLNECSDGMRGGRIKIIQTVPTDTSQIKSNIHQPLFSPFQEIRISISGSLARLRPAH